MKYWEYLLGSILLTAVATALFGYFAKGKDYYTSAILSESEATRNELREISDSLCCQPTLKNLKIQIQKLKVRLNPFGAMFMPIKLSDDEFVMEYIHNDSYFAEFFAFVEDPSLTHDQQAIGSLITAIQGYIAILLKADWERKKKQTKYYSDYLIYSLITVPMTIACFFYTTAVMQVNSIYPSLLFKMECILFVLSIVLLYFIKSVSSKLSKKNAFFNITSFGTYLKMLLPLNTSKGKTPEIIYGKKITYQMYLYQGLTAVIAGLLMFCVFCIYKIGEPYNWGGTFSPKTLLDMAIILLLFLTPTFTCFFRIFRHFEKYVLTDYSIRRSIENIRNDMKKKFGEKYFTSFKNKYDKEKKNENNQKTEAL